MSLTYHTERTFKQTLFYNLTGEAMSSGIGLFVNWFALVVVFWFLCCYAHEFGHWLADRVLGYKPIALLTILFVLPISVLRERVNNKKDEAIIGVAGPLLGLFTNVCLALIIERLDILPNILIWITSLAVPLMISLGDLYNIWMIPRYSIEERERKILIVGKRYSWTTDRLVVAFIFSNALWRKWKSKQEQVIGKKINFKEVIIKNGD